MSANLINADNFVFGIVTFGGTYLLSISDANKLLSYFSGIDYNNDSDKDFYRGFYSSFVNPSKSTLENEVGLLQFLRLNDLGLQLHKGNVNDFNEWNI